MQESLTLWIDLCDFLCRFVRTGAKTMGLKLCLEKSVIQASLNQTARSCWPCDQIDI